VKVVLLYDEPSATAREDELDVLVEADAIEEALAVLGHTAERLPFSLDLPHVTEALRRCDPDCVFNLVEAVEGHGRLVFLAPALLDNLNLPYTGAGTEAIFTSSSKLLTKRLLRGAGIPTAPWVTLGEPIRTSAAPGRYIIKLVWEEASIGLEEDAIVDVASSAILHDRLVQRAELLKGDVFAETYIAGREFNLSVLAGPDGPEVLPPAEIRFVDFPADQPRIVGYRAKWDSGSFEYHHTPHGFDFAPRDRPLLAELCRLARACWELLGLRGYARVDFRVDEAGQPWVLEINANPCLSPDAGFLAAAQRAGLSPAGMIARILDAARCDADATVACPELAQ
jgi:D-alanine-D-alanine ligase